MIIILISGNLVRMHELAEGSWSELAREAVTSGERRAGAARRAVIELLAGERCCLGAQEIAERLRGAGQPVGVASVYRTLDLLSAEGLVQRVDVGGAGSLRGRGAGRGAPPPRGLRALRRADPVRGPGT